MFSFVEDAGIRNAPCAGAAALRCNGVVLVGDLEVCVGAEGCGWDKTELPQVSPEPKSSDCSAPGAGKPSRVAVSQGQQCSPRCGSGAEALAVFLSSAPYCSVAWHEQLCLSVPQFCTRDTGNKTPHSVGKAN